MYPQAVLWGEALKGEWCCKDPCLVEKTEYLMATRAACEETGALKAAGNSAEANKELCPAFTDSGEVAEVPLSWTRLQGMQGLFKFILFG